MADTTEKTRCNPGFNYFLAIWNFDEGGVDFNYFRYQANK